MEKNVIFITVKVPREVLQIFPLLIMKVVNMKLMMYLELMVQYVAIRQ